MKTDLELWKIFKGETGLTKIEQIISDNDTENFWLEYKGFRPGCQNDKNNWVDFLGKQMSAFANSQGGLIIFGIGEDKKNNELISQPISNVGAFQNSIENKQLADLLTSPEAKNTWTNLKYFGCEISLEQLQCPLPNDGDQKDGLKAALKDWLNIIQIEPNLEKYRETLVSNHQLAMADLGFAADQLNQDKMLA